MRVGIYQNVVLDVVKNQYESEIFERILRVDEYEGSLLRVGQQALWSDQVTCYPGHNPMAYRGIVVDAILDIRDNHESAILVLGESHNFNSCPVKIWERQCHCIHRPFLHDTCQDCDYRKEQLEKL
jgi:hypothetical protein